MVGSHARLTIIRDGLADEERIEWHRALAYAHGNNPWVRGRDRSTLEGSGAPKPNRAIYWVETNRARSDGDHPRAVEMIRVSLASASTDAERIRLLGSLVDSLSRCGRYLEAAHAIDELKELDPEMAYALQGRRCQLYLLAGELAQFQNA